MGVSNFVDLILNYNSRAAQPNDYANNSYTGHFVDHQDVGNDETLPILTRRRLNIYDGYQRQGFTTGPVQIVPFASTSV